MSSCFAGLTLCQHRSSPVSAIQHSKMCAWALLMLSCSLCCIGCRGEVTELTDLTFDKRVTGGEVWFIDVYAPWCIHCRELEPIWETVAGELKGLVNVGKVSTCLMSKSMAKKPYGQGSPRCLVIESIRHAG